MSEILRLEYACTPAEMEEAQSLNLRRQVGGGSKWRTWLVLVLILFGMLLALYQQIIREVPPAYRPYAVAGFVSLVLLVFLWQRRSRKNPPETTRVEMSESEFAIVGMESRVAMPWSAFSECLESPKLFVLLDRPKGLLVVLPKRAFPNESSQDWFRIQARDRRGRAETGTPATVATQSSPDKITVRFKLGYGDYLDRTVASYRTWGIFLAVGAMILGINLYVAANPPPNAIYTASQVFFMFELPFLLVMALVGVFLIALYAWRASLQYLVPQQLTLGETSIAFADRDASGSIPWTTYTRYKETRWSFILWTPPGSVWAMLPKRAFATREELERCRALLARQLVRSRWFLG